MGLAKLRVISKYSSSPRKTECASTPTPTSVPTKLSENFQLLVSTPCFTYTLYYGCWLRDPLAQNYNSANVRKLTF